MEDIQDWLSKNGFQALAVIGFVFGMIGVVALARLEKLTKTLKAKGILEENFKEEYDEKRFIILRL